MKKGLLRTAIKNNGNYIVEIIANLGNFVRVKCTIDDIEYKLERKVYLLRYRKCFVIDNYKFFFDSTHNIYSIQDQSIQDQIVSIQDQIVIETEVEKEEIETVEVETEEEIDIDEEIKHEKYDMVKTCLDNNIPVYLAGEAGTGKNYLVEQICKENGWNFYFSNSIQQEYKLTGFIDAGGKFHETEFYKACTDDKECVFFLDEIDASIPEVLILLNAAIANGYFEFPNGKVEINNVHFVAAGNTVGSGSDELYTGRMVLDQATLDRFAIIEIDYDKRIEMKLANNNKDLVEFVRNLRQQSKEKGIRATFSYRCISMSAKLIDANMDIKDILMFKGMDKDTINTFDSIDNNKFSYELQELKVA